MFLTLWLINFGKIITLPSDMIWFTVQKVAPKPKYSHPTPRAVGLSHSLAYSPQLHNMSLLSYLPRLTPIWHPRHSRARLQHCIPKNSKSVPTTRLTPQSPRMYLPLPTAYHTHLQPVSTPSMLGEAEKGAVYIVSVFNYAHIILPYISLSLFQSTYL